MRIVVDESSKLIASAEVARDAVCGCARFVAEGLIGIHVEDAEEKAGLLHHHYPCMASMVKDIDFNKDTLMHASGHLLRNNVKEQVKSFKVVRYFQPGNKSD